MANVNSVQPLALMHNNEIVCIEKNDQTIQEKFSCFKIFKLKRPVDVNLLLNIIFPPSERDHYDLEISEYTGRSAKVKFNFTNKTHNDLIQHLQNAAAKFYDISDNGLADWLASDTITFKSVYQHTDITAIQQLSTSNNNFDDVSDYYTDFDIIPSSSSSSSSSTSPDLQIYPILNEEIFELELKELSERISLQKDPDLERIFYNTFQRRDMTVTVTSLTSEFFSQINNIVAFVGKDDKGVSAIDDNFMLDSNTIVHNFSRHLFKQAERYINSLALGGGFLKDYKFGIILTLWNLINALHSIHLSYQVLLDSDEAFKQILQSQKDEFTNLLSNIDKSLMDLLIILHDEIDREKYERLQRRLVNFVKATENLMNLVMVINNKCDEQLEKLENQKNGLTNKLLVAAITIGISAIVIGGFLYNNNNKRRKIAAGAASAASAISKQEWFEKALTCASGLTGVTAGAAMVGGYLTKSKLQNAIEKQTNILDQLKSAHLNLSQWKNLGEIYIERDINDMNNNRMTFIDEFVKIRLQCKCLNDIFDFSK